MDITIDTLIEKSDAPVSLPEVFIRINQLTQDPNSSVAEISQVTETDIGLSSKLLKLVNSPYYGFPSSIDSIPRAITIIGIQDLRDLTLATTTVDLFANKQHKQKHIRQLWRHSLHCAINARLLAETIKQQHTERFFVSGLLHDIGRLILFQGIPEKTHKFINQATETGKDLLSIEHALLGFTHTDIGCRIAHLWNLPENIVETIAFHHAPEKAREYPLETAIIHIANHMANIMDEDSSTPGEPNGINQHAWEISGLNMDMVNEVLSNAPQQFAEMHALLMPEVKAA
jgi:putative nucleotidyltransferase with HDIG domain